MRYKVETRWGSISYDERDEAKARALYVEEGIRLRLTADLFDDRGVILEQVTERTIDFRKAAAA